MAPNANPEPFHFSLANLFKRKLKIMNSRLKGRPKIQGQIILSNNENAKFQLLVPLLYSLLIPFNIVELTYSDI